jgi:CRP/FNR family transcriptional regulator, cyclic AMP receptor protein
MDTGSTTQSQLTPRQRNAALRTTPGDSHTGAGGLVNTIQRLTRPTTVTRTVSRNSNVYVCGEAGSTLFTILSGWTKRVVPDADGKETIIDFHTTGELFGENTAADGMRHDSVVAKSDCVVQVIAHDELQVLLRENDLVSDWTQFLVARLLQQQEIITHFVNLDSERRLAARLKMLAERTHPGPAARVHLPRITHEELAGMIGTTRSRVGVFLQRFEEAGLISRSRGCIVVSPGRLHCYVTRHSQHRYA